MAPGYRHPLLGLRRCETHRLCAAAGIDLVDDPSNADPAFVRNRVRSELLPLCAEVAGRDPVPLLSRQAGVLRDDVELLNALAAAALPDPSDARAVARSPRPVARRAVRTWLRTQTRSPSPAQSPAPVAHPPPLAEVDRVLHVAPGKALGTALSGGRQVRRTKGRL